MEKNLQNEKFVECFVFKYHENRLSTLNFGLESFRIIAL